MHGLKNIFLSFILLINVKFLVIYLLISKQFVNLCKTIYFLGHLFPLITDNVYLLMIYRIISKKKNTNGTDCVCIIICSLTLGLLQMPLVIIYSNFK